MLSFCSLLLSNDLQPFGVVDGVDYCWTGFPRKIEIERIRQVHETNDIVLLTSLGVSPSGEIFNVSVLTATSHCLST
jgi:acetylglutamate kinase